MQADRWPGKRRREAGPDLEKEWPGMREEGMDELLQEIGSKVDSK